VQVRTLLVALVRVRPPDILRGVQDQTLGPPESSEVLQEGQAAAQGGDTVRHELRDELLARCGIWGGCVMIGAGAAQMGNGQWVGFWTVLVGAFLVAFKVRI
jgi:hypothetical protein